MRFALIGVGYIAPRHLKAIADTGNTLVAAFDPHDGVGILDSYFPEAEFFTEFNRFERYIEMLRHKGQGVDWVSICSPSHLHDTHVRFALRAGANALCEKPLVLSQWNLDALEAAEEETGRRVFTVMQLRHHPLLIELKKAIAESGTKTHTVRLTYHAPRGKWYDVSWKGDDARSGGLLTNIGVHPIDVILWLFGKPVNGYAVGSSSQGHVEGRLRCERADVEFSLATKNHSADRSLTIDGHRIEFTDITGLHTTVYREVLAGRGFGIADVRPSLELIHQLRVIANESCANG